MPAQADSIRSKQWYLDAMNADEMWKTSTGAGVTVAIIDTGVQADLPDLRGQVLPGKDFSELPGGATSDDNGHGTRMAMFIAGTGRARGGQGSLGLAPGAKILPLRIANASFASAIRYAADSEAKIVNISMGSLLGQKSDLESEKHAVDYALSKGKLIFAGVGNSAQKGNPLLYPAGYAGVVGVGAVNRDGEVTAESERGPQVALVAPGADMYSTCKGGTGVCTGHGTSDASALASASAALVWSKHPDWTANQVLRVLINTAGRSTTGEKRNDNVGYGLIRPRVALEDPGDPGAADIHPLTGKPTSAMPAPAVSEAVKPRASETDTPDQAAGRTHEDHGTMTWVVAGIGAAALFGAAVAALTRTLRRSRK
ncbi:type VII secretion-associated serine protease mycosin [Streptomyces orinoci]|uniref:Type VII secretion-associated serine protease mycosin n=1 Tax=Streptomyces orinoci TaxID=67339 RepID=A0ABV3K7H1_STRON|nr:type VII secretion-associated serine protease mycosin [Streptomyces orinoci]